MNVHRWFATVVTICISATPAFAQPIVVPSNPVENFGSLTFFLTTARTYVGYYDHTNFAAITSPTLITGMQIRSFNTVPGSFPTQEFTLSDMTIVLSQASAAVSAAGGLPSAATPISQIQGADVTTVRSGPLTIPANAFPDTGNPHPFGPVFNFSTPYLFSPGQDLILYYTHPDGTNPSVSMGSTGATTHYANSTIIQSYMGTTTPSGGGQAPPLIVQFTFSPIPEPSSMALAGIGLCGIALRFVRRRRRV